MSAWSIGPVLELEMLLWPEQNHLKRDLGLVLARCGLSQPASIWLDKYLQSTSATDSTARSKGH